MMNISVKILKEIKLDNFIVFASLPDMGKVGGLVSEHLIKEFKVEKFAEIGLFEKPWVKNENGLVKPVIDTYDLYINYENKIIVMTGKEQPQDPSNLFNLCITTFNIIKDVGVPKIIYTAGGYHQPQLAQAPKVYAVSTDNEIVSKLKTLGINVFDNKIAVVVCIENIETKDPYSGRAIRTGVIATNAFERMEPNYEWSLIHHHGSHITNYIPPNTSSH
jgi:proteasome assembly chaperone (PAC2) family protein